MPERKKANRVDANLAIIGSLKQFDPLFCDEHRIFTRKVSSQVETLTLQKSETTTVKVPEQAIPACREAAIEHIYTEELKEYLDKKMFLVKASIVKDSLESVLTPFDAPSRILHWPPYYKTYMWHRKADFERFASAVLDPLNRFTSHLRELSPAQVAKEDAHDGWLLGLAFEAIVASYAVHNVKCRKCYRMQLAWCGGSDSSWRDMFCKHCHSCYEIKTKANQRVVDKVLKYDSLQGGSYRRWCEEGFPDRKIGVDYIVLVSREKCASTGGWHVGIAEIGTALPAAVDKTFAECDRLNLTLKTLVTMKNYQRWFEVPDGNLPDHAMIFSRSFKKVFPSEWPSLFPQEEHHDGQPVHKAAESIPKTVEALQVQLQSMHVKDVWDEDSDDELVQNASISDELEAFV